MMMKCFGHFILKRRMANKQQHLSMRIMATRFNTFTWNENEKYRAQHAIQGSIYNSMRRVKDSIPTDAPMVVFEMNNETNTIMGVSLLFNRVRFDDYYKIHSDCDYNQFTYKSNQRIDKDR